MMSLENERKKICRLKMNCIDDYNDTENEDDAMMVMVTMSMTMSMSMLIMIVMMTQMTTA